MMSLCPVMQWNRTFALRYPVLHFLSVLAFCAAAVTVIGVVAGIIGGGCVVPFGCLR